MKAHLASTQRRLLPYYLVLALEGFVLWFAVEKVFMRDIGFSDADITIAIAVVGVVVLLTEIPFGILADRTSRKGMTALLLIFFLISTIIMGRATTHFQYLVGMVFFALYGASGSGLDDSIIYDTTTEEEGRRDNYERYYGHAHILISVSLVISSFLGGYVGSRYGLPATYILTVPFIVLALLALVRFKEPKLHRQTEKTFVVQHLKETMQHAVRPGILRWILVAMLSIGVISQFLLETDQLWPLALGLPLIWYGPLNAALLSGYGVAGWLSSKITRLNTLTRLLVCAGLGCIALLTIRSIGAVVVGQVVGLAIFSALLIVSNGKLHDNVESRYRAGVSSIVSSLTNFCFIPLVIVFGQLTTSFTIFRASLLLMPIAAVAMIAIIRILRTSN